MNALLGAAGGLLAGAVLGWLAALLILWLTEPLLFGPSPTDGGLARFLLPLMLSTTLATVGFITGGALAAKYSDPPQ